MATGTFKLKPYLELGRISNIPTVISNVLLGIALVSLETISITTVLMILSGACFYLAGMYMNDICDYKWDMDHKNSRPLVKGVVRLKQVKLIQYSLFILAFIFYFIAININHASIYALIYPLILLGFITWYNVDHKENVFSPIIMGLCRSFLILSASALYKVDLSLNSLFLILTYVAYTGALTYCAKFEHTKDYQIKLIPKVFYLLAPIFLFIITKQSMFSFLILASLSAWNLYNLFLLSNKQIGKFVTNSIAAMVLIDALIIVDDRIEWLLALLTLFIFTLFFQRKIAGT